MSDDTQQETITRPDYSDPALYVDNGNGRIHDRKTGKIVAMDGSKSPITRSNSVALANKRWDMARAALDVGLADASPSNKTAFDQLTNIGRAQGKLAAQTSRGRDSTNAAKFIWSAGGFAADRSKGPEVGGSSVISDVMAENLGKIVDFAAKYIDKQGDNA